MRVTTSYLLHPVPSPCLIFLPATHPPALQSTRNIEHVFHPRRFASPVLPRLLTHTQAHVHTGPLNHLIRRRWMWSQMLLHSRRSTSSYFLSREC